ncbi:MAG: MBL fold metallo-hydrolase [Acidobacteria bacterium RIFCSPLOWO2_12_FULL_60_22]|nr:MAG: MBL fold metallo-hydrolase [Acidobacteria bacterium RIFCSPLOWO2_12_FULL_60_22]
MYKKAVFSRPLVFLGMLFAVSGVAWAQSDTIATSKGDLKITPLNHASLQLQWDGKTIYVDPSGQVGGGTVYNGLPKGDLILVTDVHGDHQDRAKVDQLKGANTVVVAPKAVAATITEAQVINNGEKKTVAGVEIEAVPMYNLLRGPQPGTLFHDKGRGNGYILTLGGKRLYIAGDTECIPEMKALRNIDVAFVCMNLPYTMTPGEAAGCVNAFKPKIVYPYHYGQSNLQEFTSAVQGTAGVEVRLRKWY